MTKIDEKYLDITPQTNMHISEGWRAYRHDRLFISKVKLVCFSFFAFRFSFFVFRFSLFVFRFSFFAFHYSLFAFWLSPFRFSLFVFRYSFFAFRFSLFDIRNRVEYRILIFKILLWHSNWCRVSYFDIQNPILTFELGPNIVSWHSKSYFDIRNRA